jgi:hypothetical protein
MKEIERNGEGKMTEGKTNGRKKREGKDRKGTTEQKGSTRKAEDIIRDVIGVKGRSGEETVFRNDDGRECDSKWTLAASHFSLPPCRCHCSGRLAEGEIPPGGLDL